MPEPDVTAAAKTLLEILDRNQKAKSTGKWKPYMLVDAVHQYGCPATRLGQKRGPCTCGAESMCLEFDRAAKDLRRACR
jgi:hypothetical protein